MAQKKVVVLDTAGSTLDVPQGTDTYLLAEDVAITGNLSITGTVDGRNVATDGTKLDGIEALADVTDATNVNAAGAVMESDYNAQTILAATTDNTPAALTVGEQTLVGRITSGNIAALSITQARTLLSVYDEVFTSDVATVADGDYVLWYDAPWPGTVTMIRTDAASGTCTLTGKVNTTALGGTANSVSSTATEQTHSTSNTFVKGDKLQYTISANASCLTMAVAFYITRTG